MQKNKFIHEDIKAVCSSATKKLAALGLVVAVGGGAPAIGASFNRVVYAQPADLICNEHEQKRVVNIGGLTVENAGFAYLNLNGVTIVNNDGITEVKGNGLTRVYGNGYTEVSGNGETRVWGNGCTKVSGNGYTEVSGGGPTLVARSAQTVVTNPGPVSICHTDVIPPERMNEAPVIFEDIAISGFTGVGARRDVIARNANRVTVAPGITTRIQNGTEFSMGGTLEETIDNLIPDIQPSANQESNTQQRNLNFNNPRLRRFLTWAMKQFGLSGQDLIDFVQRYFIQGG